MSLARYSAVSQFGVPIENPADLKDPDTVLGLMSSYSIEGEEIPREPTDITPYYWRANKFRYYVSLAHPEGPAIVELLPCDADSETYSLAKSRSLDLQLEHVRTIIIPDDQEMMIIGGLGPRYAGCLCIHEVIAQI